MASIVRITNTGTDQRSIDLKFAERRQLHRTIAAGAFIDVQDTCSIDEINRVGLPSGFTAAVIENDDAPDLDGVATDAEIRERPSFPELTILDDDTLSIAGVPATHTMEGLNLLNGQTFAGLVLGSGTSSLTFAAIRPGQGSHNILI